VTAWWYWLLFTLTALFFVAGWLLTRKQERRDRRDAELWRRKMGGRR
jgi:hypothetical protein